jgi:hypothetical protein
MSSPSYDDAALVRVHEADDVLQEHALPAAAAAQDHGREARRHLEVEVLEHLLRAEPLAHALELDHFAKMNRNSTFAST